MGVDGRRGYRRFRFTEPGNGVVRILCDVVVKRNGHNEWIAISRHAAVPGETLVLDIDEGEPAERLTVCVIESRPVIIDGDMQHRIWLQADEPPILFEQQVRRG